MLSTRSLLPSRQSSSPLGIYVARADAASTSTAVDKGWGPSPSVGRVRSVLARSNQEGDNAKNSLKGKSFQKSNRRRGRPAHLRTPFDSPLRDGNRDRLMGLLTARAARTLLCYLAETNLNVYHWLMIYIKENPIPQNGNWDEVSGETFLRKLLSMPVATAKLQLNRDPMFDCIQASGVDPRSIAQRVMDIRSQLAKEFIQDLNGVTEENSSLLRETLNASLANMFKSEVVAERKSGDWVHPEMLP